MNGYLIKTRLIELDLSIEEVADTLNMSPQTISNWINGRNTSNIELFLSLLAYLDLDPDSLIKKKDPIKGILYISF